MNMLDQRLKQGWLPVHTASGQMSVGTVETDRKTGKETPVVRATPAHETNQAHAEPKHTPSISTRLHAQKRFKSEHGHALEHQARKKLTADDMAKVDQRALDGRVTADDMEKVDRRPT
jgi:hypothetical protein